MVTVGPHAPSWECSGCVELFRDDPDIPRSETVAMVGHHQGYSTLLRWVQGQAPVVRRWVSDRRREAGQSIVEFALVLPLLMVLLVGFAEVGCLIAQRVAWSQSVEVMADWMASHPEGDPAPVWNELEARDPCGASYTSSVDELGIVRVGAVCRYTPRVAALFTDLPVGVAAVSVAR